jgi:hypothetical protein
MKRSLVVVLLLAASCLAACDHYHYSFDTLIAPDGSVTRTIDFSYTPYRKMRVVEEPAPEEGVPVEGDQGAEPAELGVTEVEPISDEDAPAEDVAETEPAEPPAPEAEVEMGMPAPLIMPDPERFSEYELLEHGLHGTWRSNGVLYTDFRFAVPSYTIRGKPDQKIPRRLGKPKRQREAFNEGTVTTTDLVLVKTFTYFEQFHDYYTRDEFAVYADIAIERLGDFFLEVLHKDFGRRYDLDEFEKYFKANIVPFAKKWKLVLYPSLLNAYEIWDRKTEDVLSELRTREVVEMAHELVALGVLDEPYLDPDTAIMASWEWLRLSMHNLITRKRDGVPWPLDEIDAYFSSVDEEPGFFLTTERLLWRRYGDEMELTRRLLAIWDSFAETGTDSHSFEVSVSGPGVFVHVLPDPDESDFDGEKTTVLWTFQNDHFFPDGVTLSLVTAVPVREAQEALFGKIVLRDSEHIGEYLALYTRLSARTRAALIAGLRECVEKRDVELLHDAIYGHLPAEFQNDTFDEEEQRLRQVIEFLEKLRPGEEE